MPRGDGTGPMGMGSMTGRSAGYCARFKIPGFINPTVRSRIGLGIGHRVRRIIWCSGLLLGCVYLANRWGNGKSIK